MSDDERDELDRMAARLVEITEALGTEERGDSETAQLAAEAARLAEEALRVAEAAMKRAATEDD